MTSVHPLANHRLDSHISTPVAVIIIFVYYKLKKGRTELPFPEITCLDTRLLSFVKVAIKSVTVY